MDSRERRETAASRRAHRPERDPRDIVTEYAFRVDADLLGVPLAGPFRRLAAMLADLGVLALLFPLKAVLDALLGGVTDLLVAALAAWVLWRLGEERQEPSLASRVITWGGRALAAVVALLASVTFVVGLFGGGPDDGPGGERPPAVAADSLESARALARADSAAAAREAKGDSLLALWAEARAAGDTARARGLRRDLLPLVAGDSLLALRAARRENRELEARVGRLTSSEGFLRRILERVLDDLGLGFGSAALFFTVLLRLDRGRTPGKRLLGVRVVRLNGERLSWWDAFSRFGGYLVGPATGFLGWLQIFWDPNRQAVHDRIAGTVVVRTRAPG